jgi:hypothetical protein
MDFIRQYFNAERAESMVFFGLGVIAIVLATWFFLGKNSEFYRGMAYPLAIVALIQLAVGASIFMRSPVDTARVEGFVQHEPNRIASEEIPRMEKVMRQFVMLRYFEIALIALGLILIFVSKSDLWRGIGMGLTAQAAIMLACDYFAEARGHVYLDALKNQI